MRFRSAFTAAPLAAVALFAAACAPADVTGDWRGTWTVPLITDGTLLMSLTQEGDAFGGTFDIGGTGCVGSGDVEGTVDGRSFHAELRNDVGGEVVLDGTVGAADENIRGDFLVTAGFCEESEGNFDVNRE